MTDDDRLAALFAAQPPIADDGFTERVAALVALDMRLALRRRALRRRLAVEAAALAGVLVIFAALARVGAPSDVVPLASPAMIGLLLLSAWLTIGMRGSARAG